MNKCLYCYGDLSPEEKDFHPVCSKKMFGSGITPVIHYDLKDIKRLALENLVIHTSVTGVQPKISLDIPKSKEKKIRFTITGMWGAYILKPPIEAYPEMPELEDLTMKIAEAVNIKTAEHSLIRLKSGELAYITKRFDRSGNEKIHIEDMAQITGVLTEYKYRSSMEKIAGAIKKYSSFPGIDLITFFETAVIAFLTGNADMHLKNFSLIRNEFDELMLSPAYDLLSTNLLIKEDKEEMALTLNGKKNKLRREDFNSFAEKTGLNAASVKNSNDKIYGSRPKTEKLIEMSFLSDEMKEEYLSLYNERFTRFFDR